MESYIKVMSNYAVFSGRASRKEYWMFFLFNILVSFAIGVVGGITKMPALAAVSALYSLVTFIPSFAVAIRRIHDTGRSGWWFLFPIYNFVLLLTAGDKCENDYGPDPYADDNNNVSEIKKAA